MPKQAVPVKWEIAVDEHFRHIVKRGTEMAKPNLGHSVHVEADGLKPNKVYYYRFKSGMSSVPSAGRKRCPLPVLTYPP
ncbi:PhoD-like phosphatase N-terminal domain-containing protein [Bacillus amyloliquefaciens]|uniref:PhoD-like phosphatase N-terminal domain-containing protein n=1 Tax=Bacillus amyloliquefaciens TaxID=1390 RepID=UPI0013B04F3B